MHNHSWLRRSGSVLIFVGLVAAIPGQRARAQSHEAGIRGVVRSVQQATVSTNEPLLALSVAVRDGDDFKRGDLLVQFDCDRLKAERGAAVAALREAELNWESSRKLDEFNAIGKIDVKIGEQRRSRAAFDVAALDARLRECRLDAPFDGRVAEVTVRAFERTVAQRPYINLVSAAQLEIEAIVPSSLLAEIKIGTRFEFQIDELRNITAPARVKAIGATVDPVSKTVKILGELEKPVPGILTGMSGTVSLSKGG